MNVSTLFILYRLFYFMFSLNPYSTKRYNFSLIFASVSVLIHSITLIISPVIINTLQLVSIAQVILSIMCCCFYFSNKVHYFLYYSQFIFIFICYFFMLVLFYSMVQEFMIL